MKLHTQFSMVIPAVMVLAIVACGGGGGKPTIQPLPTPTTPPDFVAFTDESNSFAIRYPPDWELALSQMSAIEGEVKEFLEGKFDAPLENLGTVFLAGDTTRGFTVNIQVESLPSTMTVDAHFEATTMGLREALRSWKMNGQSRVVVGERAAMISDSEFDLSELGRGQTGTLRAIQLTSVQGKVGWTVTCSFPTAAFQQIGETCDSLVRTFRILQ